LTASNKGRKTYVLDTSVLLADPGALARFAEHEVVVPITVIGELETKRDHPELGYFARAALRSLDDIRLKYGRLDQEIKINSEGGTLSVELNHTDLSSMPHGFLRDGTNDSRILAIAKNLMSDGKDVVLVTKDLPLRVKASSVGVEAEEYLAELVSNSGWTGIVELSVGSSVIDDLYASDFADHEEAHSLPIHTGVVLHSDRASALARVTPDKRLQLDYMAEAPNRELRWTYYSILKLELSPWAVEPVLENLRSPYAPGLKRSWSEELIRRS
jgi:PhoH-like ATPase